MSLRGEAAEGVSGYTKAVTPAAIIFDLDDTLASRAAGLAKYASMLAEDFSAHLHSCSLSDVHAALLATDDFGSIKQALALAKSSLWRTAPSEHVLFDHWTSRFGAAATPFPGAIELLQTMRRLRIKGGLITNGDSAMQRSKIAALGIEPLLDVIVISSEVGAQKPESSIFNFALGELGCTAAEAWFVGDHPDQDVRGAAMAGLRAFWVPTGSARDSNPPGTQLNSLEDLQGYLRPL